MMVPVDRLFEKAERGSSAADKVPATLSHCVLAVNKKGHKVRDAWNICRASQVRSKHLKGPYKRDGKLRSSTRQTQKGARRSMKHAMEKDGPDKYNRFKKLFRKIEPSV